MACARLQAHIHAAISVLNSSLQELVHAWQTSQDPDRAAQDAAELAAAEAWIRSSLARLQDCHELPFLPEAPVQAKASAALPCVSKGAVAGRRSST